MKKQQKIIEINEEKNIELAKLRSDHTSCCAYYAAERYTVKSNYAKLLQGVTDENKRGDLRADRAMKIAEIDMKERASKAMYEREVAELLSSTAVKKTAATDDPEPEKLQPQQQETVRCDGSEHSARIVARRLINKMPHITRGGSLSVSVLRQDNGEFFVSVNQIGKTSNTFTNATFSKLDGEEKESDFVEKARKLFAGESESGNSHVAEPLSRALDAIFGGNPVKDRKEGGDE